MPPTGVSQAGDEIKNPAEKLIRRARLKKHRYVADQITGKLRPPSAAFEPRLPETHPNALRFDRYLSVNALSSLVNDGEAADWGCNHKEFYVAWLLVEACQSLSLVVTWEPIAGLSNPDQNNPHHAGIHGVVELFIEDRDLYDLTITKLASASEVLL